MKKQKIDLRIIKTKKNLYESLLTLMEERPFEKIKVSDICSQALINRSTFYAHFEDKYTLLASLINDLKSSLEEELNQNKHYTNSKEYYMEIIKLLLNHMDKKKNIYIPIIINNKNSIAMDMIYDTLNADIIKRIEQNKTKYEKNIPSDFIAKFYLGAIFNVGMEWLKNNKKYSKEEIVEYLNDLIPNA